MDPNPKSSKFKFAFTGTNSSGKTSMALDTTARLKFQHVLAEVVSSQDRKITWKDDHFPVDPRAHYGMICNLINAEVQAELKGDAHVVITDRSVLDLYAIFVTDHPGHYMTKGLEQMVRAWMTSYTRVYYLPPLKYQEDGKRPSDEFRMKTHATLRMLMEKHAFTNVVEIPREYCFKDICKKMGVYTEKPIFAEREKWTAFAKMLGCTVLVKAPKSEISSDIDVWVCTDMPFVNVQQCQLLAESYFGNQVKIDFMVVPKHLDARSLAVLGDHVMYGVEAK